VAPASLRALRVAFDEFGFRGGADATKAVDGWLSYAVHDAGEELEIDPRRDRSATGRTPLSLADPVTPRSMRSTPGTTRRTWTCTTLSLFFLPEPHPVKDDKPFSFSVNKEVLNASHELRYDPHARLAVPPRGVEIPCCLRETTMEINFVHYQGSVAQRALAKCCSATLPSSTRCAGRSRGAHCPSRRS
jgi:hypothetical protein